MNILQQLNFINKRFSAFHGNYLTRVAPLSFLFFTFPFLLFTFLPSPIHAQEPPAVTFQQPSLFSITSIGEFVGGITTFMFLIAGVLMFIYLIWGGLQYMSAGPDQQAIAAARSRITTALIGLAIIGLGLAITIILEAFFGIRIIEGPTDTPIPFPRGFE